MRPTLLADCAARSRPLTATLDPTTDGSLPPEFDPDDLLATWRDIFDGDDEFRERLDLADESVESVESVREHLRDAGSGSGTPDSDDSIPAALRTAEEVADRAVELDAEAVRPLRERHADAPFVDLLGPLAAAVCESVSLDADHDPAAVESLEDWLFERLTTTFQHPLFILFKTHQQREYPDTDFSAATDLTAVYDEFVADVRNADYEPVFEEYPVLLELLGVVADQWRGMVRRLDDRLAADRDLLSRTFGEGDDDGDDSDGEPLGRLRDVATFSDDPHGEGEIVLRLDFESRSVVYKPRSVGGEAAFGDLLDWTNRHADVPDLYAPTALDRGDYGWMEHVSHRPCDSAAAVGRYYERMGALTALAFLLGSTDLHHDNLVAMGEHPVIVDQETVLSPRVGSSNKPVSPAMDSLLGESVLNTVLIPFTGETGGPEDDQTTGGLTDLADEQRREKRPNFHHPNTDAMELTFDKPYRPGGRNLPRFDGEVRGVSSNLAELKRGFRAVTDAILADRERFLAPDGPLAAFEECPIRYLPRPTSHYASKLSESLYSSQLRSGTARSLALESLYAIFVPRADDEANLWKLVSTEKDAVRRLTIPRFTVPATGRELRDGRGNPQGVTVAESPLDHARRRVSELDDHRVETQLRLVDLAFTGATVSDPVAAPDDDENSIVAADSPREVVSNVVARIDDATTRYPDGSLRWAELARSSPTGQFSVREPTLDLYRGHVGVGLFLAAVAAVRDDDDLADRSRRILRPVRSAVEESGDGTDGSDDDAEEVARLGLGGMDGRGSVAYGLLVAGDLLDDDDLVASARTAAGLTTREEIADDRTLDVMAGSAGELLAQLAVHERTGDEAALDRARWCGDHLLDAAVETDAGYRVPTAGDGDDADRRFAFAHGVGGVGYALVKLAEVTGEETYAEVGRDALALDAELWRRDGNRAGSDENATIWGWCNGAVGVGTGRVAVADAMADEDGAVGEEDAVGEGGAVGDLGDLSVVREDLRPDPSREDSLCCGSAGRALFLLDAGEVVGDSSLAARGEALFRRTLDRGQREGRLRLSNHLPMLPRLGLFTGIAGVGYVALQLEAREADVDVRLPNVTRLE
ncbi:type 2 lanthipeptide synthetase LanM family protein [Halorussus salinus]|uniref:type 2 lanthipeptide synthetase LanM family protein n=1 Tax=Halorussus salinus TaxID=1364935 RepID=UPI001091C501|nr:type 2 lanthipeptide synthetase LanM family protein [Halorussus salinus]